MDKKEFQEGFKEVMEAYINERQKWVNKFGTDSGFDNWFTKQIKRC